MKPKSALIIFLLFLTTIAFSDDAIIRYEVSNESGFDLFFKQNVGKEISVTIINLDITINGLLIAVYKDSIILRSFSKDVFILKTQIAFAKVKVEEETEE